MGRYATVSEKGAENTVLSYRAARAVARELRSRGWAASARLCRGRTPLQVAKILAGPVTGQEDRLAVEIAAMAGLVPAEAVQG